MRKELGKIQFVHVGYGGYQDAMMGITFTLGGSGWGVGDFWGTWGCRTKSKGAKWTEGDRDAEFAKTMRRIDQLLQDAKVDSVDRLRGVPVECEFSDQRLKSWRVLSEVL